MNAGRTASAQETGKWTVPRASIRVVRMSFLAATAAANRERQRERWRSGVRVIGGLHLSTRAGTSADARRIGHSTGAGTTFPGSAGVEAAPHEAEWGLTCVECQPPV